MLRLCTRALLYKIVRLSDYLPLHSRSDTAQDQPGINSRVLWGSQWQQLLVWLLRVLCLRSCIFTAFQ